jgi:hypothetical protein
MEKLNTISRLDQIPIIHVRGTHAVVGFTIVIIYHFIFVLLALSSTLPDEIFRHFIGEAI